jgi:pimeloyl-ACP methyl ester carboxylesterase
MDANDFQLVFLDSAAHIIVEERPDVVVEHVLELFAPHADPHC